MQRVITALALLALLLTLPPAFAEDAAPAATDAAPAATTAEDVAPAADAAPATDVAPATDTAEDAAPAAQPETGDEAVKTTGALVAAIKSKEWAAVVGFILMLLVFILDKLVNLRKIVGPKGLPWVAASFGIVSHVGIALATGGVSWYMALINGLVTGATAVGLWEMTMKNLVKKSEDTESDAEPATSEESEAV